MSDRLVSTTYNQLKAQIAEIVTTGRERARQAVEQEKVRTCWEVGRLLHEHLLEFKERADYGGQLLKRLYEELEIGERRLYEMLEFYRRFPILRASAKLTFSHYVKLLSQGESRARDFYLDRVEEDGWSVRQLEQAIKTEIFELAEAEEVREKRPAALFRARRGRLHTYQLVEVQGRLQLDLGFGICFAAPLEGLEGISKEAMVASVQSGEGYEFAVGSTRRRLYTYRAVVREVIDGDTLWAEIDCGFGVWTRQKLRLRGIDVPERSTAGGWQAQSFVRETLRQVDFALVTISRPDKYDRYLADLFYLPGEVDPGRVAVEGRCLNQELLSRGLAELFEK